MPRLSITIQLSITGRSALAAVHHDLSGDAALSLSKFADPTEEAEDDISPARAREIIASDPSLVRLDADLEIWCMDRPWYPRQTWARVGHLSVRVEPAKGHTPTSHEVITSAAPPEGCEAIRPSSLGAELEAIKVAAGQAFAVHIRRQLDALGEP